MYGMYTVVNLLFMKGRYCCPGTLVLSHCVQIKAQVENEGLNLVIILVMLPVIIIQRTNSLTFVEKAEVQRRTLGKTKTQQGEPHSLQN